MGIGTTQVRDVLATQTMALSPLKVRRINVNGKLAPGVRAKDVYKRQIHICPRSGFYDLSNKYPWMNMGGGTDYICPADLPEETAAKVQEAALRCV